MKTSVLLHALRTAAVLLLLNCRAFAGTDKPIMLALDGSKNQLKPDSAVLVRDSMLLFDPSYLSKLESVMVKNSITFKINEASPYFLQTPFSASVKVRISIIRAGNATETVDTVLAISYDTASTYVNRSIYLFTGAYSAEVKVLEVSSNASWDVWPALMIENELQRFPVYKFSCIDNAIQQVSHEGLAATTRADELRVNWQPVMQADQYDLEWTYIDTAALAGGLYNSSGALDPIKIFDNNASRVTITGTLYKIPLLYEDTGSLFFRVRPVQLLGQGRLEAAWSSAYPAGLGRFGFYGHQDSLNWQATTSFAEEGKRKTVVQYYDGSLNGRQTVTRDNSTGTALVSETLLDHQGRPTIQVLPAPTLSNVIGYYKNFNTGLNGSLYDKDRYDVLSDTSAYCSTGAQPMDTLDGASRYYSGANPFKGDSIHRYVPDAQGYPFTQTEYTQDNTGRISRQSGVGEQFRIGSDHDTRYYYGTPGQEELDALFGTEAGDHSHYYKSMVRDANGQFSVSYTDMHGRTIATALSARPQNSSLDTLASYKEQEVTERLSDPRQAVIKDLVMESKKGLLVSVPSNHTFTYSLSPASLSLNGCDSTPVCYDCLYDLEITIASDCDNMKVGTDGKPFVTRLSNFSLSSIDTACNGAGLQVSFTRYLVPGSYDITKKLSVSRSAMSYYLDSIFLIKNLCRSLASFVDEQRQIVAAGQQCQPVCASCSTGVGSWSSFKQQYNTAGGGTDTTTKDSTGAAWTAYQQALEGCRLLCDSVNEQDDARRAMLADLTPPSGQYANLDSLEDKYSIFYTTDSGPDTMARYRKPASYLDEAGVAATAYDEVSGRMVPPQALSQEAFEQKFQPSWAQALLAYHPEYCKLQTYETLAESFRWDKRFGAVDTYREAVQKGYLNPTEGLGTTYTRYDAPGVQADRDPLAKGLLSSLSNFKARLEDSLTKYRRRTDTQAFITLWSLSSITAKCTTPGDQSCFNTYLDNTKAFDSTTMCTGDLDMAWRAFRQSYLDVKKDVVDKYISAFCANKPGSVSAATLVAAGHQPNFGNAADLLQASGLAGLAGVSDATSGPARQAGRDSLSSYYRSSCLAYASTWWQQLQKPCGLTAADSAAIISRLVQVCALGSDVSHPFGASTAKPGSTGQDSSFEQVLREYLVSAGGSYDSSCNVYLMPSPLPYGSQGAVGEVSTWTKPDSCQCSSITAMYRDFQVYKRPLETFAGFLFRSTGTAMTSSALDSLRSLCTGQLSCTYLVQPLYIPPVFQCGVRNICVPCGRVDSLYRVYRSEFPGSTPAEVQEEDSVQLQRNGLFERFMNSKLGFSMQWAEYLQFMARCGIPLQQAAPSCGNLDSLLQAFSQANTLGMQYAFHPTTTTTSVPDPTFTDTRTIFRGGIAQLPDSIRVKPRSFYTSLEAAMHGRRFCFMDSGYSVELRVRMPNNPSNDKHFYVANGRVTAIFFSPHDATGQRTGFSFMDGFSDGQGGNYGTHGNGNGNGFSYIQVDTGHGFDRFQNIRLRFTRANYQVYYNNTLLWTAPVADSTQGIYTTFNPVAAFVGNDGAVDWLKVYDSNDQLQFMESFDDSLHPVLPDPSLLCPAPSDCQGSFTAFFNQARGTAYSYYQVDSVYRAACGYSPEPCFSNKVYDGPLLCGKTQALFPLAAVEQADNCSDSAFFIASVATELYQAYKDSLTSNFLARYKRACLQAYKYESFTVTHATSEFHYTLYYYDQAGNLVRTVPPAGVDASRFGWASQWSDSVQAARSSRQRLVPAHVLGTGYRYNTLNQVVAQATPDAGTSLFWYDRLGRLSLSQNARQQAESQSETGRRYSYTLYDSIGRITEVGETANQGATAMTDSISRNPQLLSGWLSASAAARSQITSTVYDMAYAGFTGLQPAPLMQKNLRNRVSYSSYTLGSNASQYNQATLYSYDIHGNVDTLLQDYGNQGQALVRNVMNANGNRFKKLVYGYDLISGKVGHVAYQHGAADRFYHRYVYDAENRLTAAHTSHDSVTWESDARYSYYRHGPLARAVLGHQQVQGMDYAYTLQGWLKGVNSMGLGSSLDMGGDGKIGSQHQQTATDALAFSLHYYGGDYQAIGINARPFPGYSAYLNQEYRPLYNGNISSQSVSIAKLPGTLLYNYRYDQLNRITAMDTYKVNQQADGSVTGLDSMQDYRERVSYDGNGNIERYQRNGTVAAGLLMDSLEYHYSRDAQGRLSSNKLQHITDRSGGSTAHGSSYSADLDNQQAGNYSYDAIGNLVGDTKEGVDSILWNVYGKITEVRKNATMQGSVSLIQYGYDAAGMRISKRVERNGSDTVEVTWYARDAQGSVMAVYESRGKKTEDAGVYNLSLKEQHLYGSSRLGMVRRNVDMKAAVATQSIYKWIRGNKLFELSNHLGNVMAVVTDSKRGVSTDGTLVSYYQPVVASAQDYYPFGMAMPGRGGYASGIVSAAGDETGGSEPQADITISSRTGNTPPEYRASRSITFVPGFESGAADSFETVLSSTGSGSGGTGGGWVETGVSGSKSYRYTFNGKENDSETSTQDYGMRIYDPRVGRFLSVDPIGDKFPFYSSYLYASNMPILTIDIDGLESGKIKNWIENSKVFVEGLLDGFTNYDPTKPLGQQETVTNTFMQKKFVDYKQVIKQIIKHPGNSVKRVIEQVGKDIKQTGNDIVSGDPYKMGRGIGSTARTGAEVIVPAIAEGRAVRTTENALKNFGTRTFTKGDPLVLELANSLENASPGLVKNVERIIKDEAGRTLTDFDIELPHMIIEVTSGSAKGKGSQILNNILPNTNKEVVLFIEGKGGKTVEKELTKIGVRVFRDRQSLVEYAKNIPQY